jgi:hypothetical protein
MARYDADEPPAEGSADGQNTKRKRWYDELTDEGGDLDRRSFLKAAGVATTGVAASGLAGPASAASFDIDFDRVVNAVDDLGMDPNGNDPVDSAFESAYESGTLIEFPPGEYRITEAHVSEAERFGIRGLGNSRRDVQFKPPAGESVRWIQARGGGPHLMENVSFHERYDDTTGVAHVLRTTGGSVVRNVEWLGRTPDDNDHYGYSLTFDVTDTDGVSLCENIVAGLDAAAKTVSYPDGVQFLRSAGSHDGELIIRNPTIHRRNSSAIRKTHGSGVYTLEGGEFYNNQNANIRFGAGDHPSKESTATGTRVIVDGNSVQTGDAVRVDCTKHGHTGATFRDLVIEWDEAGGRGVIAVPDFGEHGRAEFYNCVIRNDGSLPTVLAEETPVDDDAIIVENCSFTGSGGGIRAENRSGSVIRDSCVDLPNGSISGFDTSNVSESSCRSPSESGTIDDGSDLGNTLTVRGTGVETQFTFTVSGTVEERNGSLEEWDRISTDGTTVEAWVTTTEQVDEFAYSGEVTAFGYIEGGPADIQRNGESVTAEELDSQNESPSAVISVASTDGLTVDLSAVDSADSDGDIVAHEWDIAGTAYTGETITHTFDGPGTYTATLTVEDDEGATGTTTRDVSVSRPNDLRIEGTGVETQYSVEVTGALAPVEDTIEEWDEVGTSSATGWVTTTEHVDEFTFDGEVTSLEFLEGEADVYINGTQVEPTDVSGLANDLRIEGTGVETQYFLEVTGALAPVEDTIEDADVYADTSAVGRVTDDTDAYTFEGEVITVEFLEGQADVYVNGNSL